MPVTGAVNVFDAKSAFVSKFSVSKVIFAPLAISVWWPDCVTLKAGCSGLVTSPFVFYFIPVWALFTKERLLSPW